MDFAGVMVVHSWSDSSAVDVERMPTRIWPIIPQAVRVFALLFQFYTR